MDMLVVLAGHPTWAGRAAEMLTAAGFQIARWDSDSDADAYIRWLTNLVPALIAGGWR